tara:strand:- start:3114 stop:4382 length:1269 start_codon:yes stop_codon:yes gene_type:complete
VFAEDTIEQSDLLFNDWSEEWTVESLSDFESVSNDSTESILDFISVKLKGDLAYSDTLTLARANVRILSDATPIKNSYLKVDVQFNYFNAKDDLLLNERDDEFTIKINELWVQYSKDACNLKLGRQGLFWGSVEGTRALDVVTPLDLSEPLLTDYSLIWRSQDIFNASCFYNDYDFELFVIPNPLLDQYTVRQTSVFEGLEKTFSAEWGGRITKHTQGLDLSLHYGRFYGNTPKAIIDLNTLTPIGMYVDQFELFGAGIVYAIERLLLEFELSHQKELSFQTLDSISNYGYLLNKQLKERLEFAIGAEYTTAKNHQLTSGIWFYEYESNPLLSSYVDTYVLNATWSKQFLNDDLGLSALVFWQKDPELYYVTFMANFLVSDYWSTSTAITYQHSKFDELNSGFAAQTEIKDWAIQFSVIYQF